MAKTTKTTSNDNLEERGVKALESIGKSIGEINAVRWLRRRRIWLAANHFRHGYFLFPVDPAATKAR